MDGFENLEPRKLCADFSASINFAPLSAPRAPGMLTDYGVTYAPRRGGFTYGWDRDVTAHAVDRNILTNQKNDTFITANGAKWEIAVPNGYYSVTATSGDPAVFNLSLGLDAEGKPLIRGTTASRRRFIDGTALVKVADGKLTITSAAGLKDIINCISITSVPTNLVWKTSTPMTEGRAETLSAVVGNKLYVFGGYFDATFRANTNSYCFDYATRTWKPIAALPIALAHSATASDNRYIYMSGGYVTLSPTKQILYSSKVLRYDTQTDQYSYLPDLPAPRGPGNSVIVNNKLYFMGGSDIRRTDVKTVWVLDLANTKAGWIKKADMPQPRNRFGISAVGDQIYIVGGQTSNDNLAEYKPDCWRYNTSTDAWYRVASLSRPKSHISTSTVVYNGRMIVVGGETTGQKILNEAEMYDPASNSWIMLTNLPGARFSGAMGVINNQLIFAGGYYGFFSATTYIGTMS